MDSRSPHRRTSAIGWLARGAVAVASLTVFAAPVGAQGAPAAPDRPGQVVLPTGEHVEVTAARGEPEVLLPHDATSSGLRVLRMAGKVYVIPIAADRGALDLSLFDVGELARHQDRIPVSLQLTGSTVPGVTITSRSGDTATGYLTPRSAPRLGAALRAGHGAVPGLRRMALDVPKPAAVTPMYQQYTVDVTVTPPAGVTPDFQRLFVVNVDDARKFDGGYQFAGDDQRISVPAGNYVLLDEAVSVPATQDGVYRTWTAFADLAVTGDGQTAVVDTSRATASPYPTFDVPRAATEASATIDFGITDDLGQLGLNLGGDRSSNVQELVEPFQNGPHGKLSTVAWSQLLGPASAPDPYRYDLSTGHENAVAGDEHVTLRPSDLATVDARYYGDGRPMTGWGSRFPAYPYLNPGFSSEVALPSAPGTDTEYIANSPGATWMADVTEQAQDGSAVIGELALPRGYRAGESYREDFLRGPHAPGAFSQPGIGWPYCQACRTATTMQLAFAAFTDSDPTHFGAAFGGAPGQPDQHMVVRQDGTTILEQDYSVYGRAEPFDIAAGDHDYQVVGTYDGAADGQLLSTHATTEWDFRTTAADRPVPDSWQCLADPPTPCDVLPMMTLHYALPTSLTGTMRPGVAAFVVTVGHLQGAAATPVTGLSFGTGADGADAVAQRVHPLGGGRYLVTIVNPQVAAGTGLTVTLHATDAAGGAITQTVRTAYTISGS